MKRSVIFIGYKLLTDEFLSSITFAANDRNIIKGLDSNKPHGHNMIRYLHSKDLQSFYSQTLRPDHQGLLRSWNFISKLEKCHGCPYS